MSGGVDSAVALLKAVEAGLEPVGVTLRLWIDPDAPDTRAGLLFAGVGAGRPLGLPRAGRPALRPRPARGFPPGGRRGLRRRPSRRPDAQPLRALQRHRSGSTLWSRAADRLGAPRLATGHYARIVTSATAAICSPAAPTRPRTSRTCWRRCRPEMLRRVWFPLGEQRQDGDAGGGRRRRPGGRRAPREPGGVLRRRRRPPPLPRAPRRSRRRPGGGDDRRGRVIGRHDGVHRFTPGQRRGIGVGGGAALYVLETDAATGTVVAGGREELATARVRVEPGRLHVPVGRAAVKLRYRGAAVAARWSRPAMVSTFAGRARLRRRRRTGGRALRRRHSRRVSGRVAWVR